MNVRLLRQLAQFARDPGEHTRPVAVRLLSEQTHCWIPGAVVAIDQPPPIRDLFERHPGRPAQGARQMSDGGIRSYDQVEVRHHSCCVDKGGWTTIKIT